MFLVNSGRGNGNFFTLFSQSALNFSRLAVPFVQWVKEPSLFRS